MLSETIQESGNARNGNRKMHFLRRLSIIWTKRVLADLSLSSSVRGTTADRVKGVLRQDGCICPHQSCSSLGVYLRTRPHNTPIKMPLAPHTHAAFSPLSTNRELWPGTRPTSSLIPGWSSSAPSTSPLTLLAQN